MIIQARLSKPYSLHSCNRFASEVKAKDQKGRLKGDYQLDTVTLWIWKRDAHSSICRTSNNTGDGSVSQMGKLHS